MHINELASHLNSWAIDLGFQQIGVADTDLSDYAPDFRAWLEQRFQGDMGYMARNVGKRIDPSMLVPGTLRVLSARMDYLPATRSDVLNSPDKAYISHYALGRDYHKTVRSRLRALAKQIEFHAGGQYRAFTDSAPVLEKPLAAKAGIGWVGKNTLVLNETAGSWFFLGEIFTNIPLPVNTEVKEDKCGACKACINVCPTGAIVGPKQLDARRCISYLTIEHKGVIAVELRESIGNRIFGCDDCQLVCPWNRFAQASEEPDFVPRQGLDAPTLIGLLAWNEADFLERTEGMALRRINYSQWVRNLAIASGNAQPNPSLIRAVKKKLTESRRMSDVLASEHLEWAIQKLNSR